ncbi:MAG: hybrid sensor histidine kinase/response regulator [Calditrichaeota bacterium]|nr:hybrid sensor histidine kinase/response regulator [Calditrichota bacterium]
MKKHTILIVEDSPPNIDVLTGLLSSEYKLLIATSGEKALDILSKGEPPDLILQDIMLPGMNGFEVCHRIRQKKEICEIPVIFLSGEADKDKIVQGFRVGGQDYVTKPFNPEELLSRVRTHLDLKDKSEQLKSLNRSLEDKVAERTAALRIANQKLQELNKQLEEANEQLQNLDLAKSRFLQIISHEIRTPLTGIMGFTELLGNSLDSEELQEFIQALKDSVDRLERFSQRALFITELQVKNREINKSKINILQIFYSVIAEFKPQIKSKNIRLKRCLSEELTVNADYDLLNYCLKTILHNAIEYAPENGEISIKVESADQNTIISISDNGPGFSKEALDFKFKLFALGKEPIDQNFGLGLATTNLIMKAHSGSMEIGNQPQGGAIVKLSFPG